MTKTIQIFTPNLWKSNKCKFKTTGKRYTHSTSVDCPRVPLPLHSVDKDVLGISSVPGWLVSSLNGRSMVASSGASEAVAKLAAAVRQGLTVAADIASRSLAAAGLPSSKGSSGGRDAGKSLGKVSLNDAFGRLVAGDILKRRLINGWHELEGKLPSWQMAIVGKLEAVQEALKKRLHNRREEGKEVGGGGKKRKEEEEEGSGKVNTSSVSPNEKDAKPFVGEIQPMNMDLCKPDESVQIVVKSQGRSKMASGETPANQTKTVEQV